MHDITLPICPRMGNHKANVSDTCLARVWHHMEKPAVHEEPVSSQGVLRWNSARHRWAMR